MLPHPLTNLEIQKKYSTMKLKLKVFIQEISHLK